MRRRTELLLVLAVFVLWAAALGAAQNVQITNGPTVENVTGSSAVVAWSTNVNAGTVLKYGTDPNNLSQSAQAPWGGVTHRVTLQNLQPNTTYYFNVQSTQGQGTGTGALSNTSQFKTQGGTQASNPPTPPPATASAVNPATFQVVAGPIVQHLTDNSATIFWQTNQPVQGSTLKYGTSKTAENQTATIQATADGMGHTAQLSGLKPSTTYYLTAVRSGGGASTEGQFTTEPAGFAQSKNVYFTNGPVIEQLASNQAVISWSTNVPSSSTVLYGTDANSLTQTAQAQWGGTNHRVTVTNLQPNTKYFFAVQSAQAQGTGTTAKSQPFAFQTVQPGQAALNLAH